MWPGFDSGRYFMWVEFVVGSRLALRVFLQVLRFSSLHENQQSKGIFQPTNNSGVNFLKLPWANGTIFSSVENDKLHSFFLLKFFNNFEV